MRAAEIRSALRGEPWLEPYLEDDDESIDDARERFEVAQREAEHRLAVERVTYQTRWVKAGCLVTTCLAPDREPSARGPK